MKAIAVYPADVAYDVMSRDTAHILVPIEARAASTGLAQGLHDLLTKIRTTAAQEDALVLAVALAEGHIFAVDADIDVLVTDILDGVARDFGKDHALYLLLTAGQTPSEIREPVLDEELSTVKLWGPALAASGNAKVQALGAALAAKIAEAEQRVQDLTSAEQALEVFRKVGLRHALVEEVNATRLAVYTALHQLPTTPAGASLPKGIGDTVFAYERARRRRKALSSKEIEKQIERNAKERASLDKALAEAQEAEAKASKTKTERKNKPRKAALDAAKKQREELAAKIAELEAELEES